MFQHLLVLFLGCFLCTVSDGLVKRSLDSFGEMIEAETGRNPFDFNGYGKWCGFGGSGDPVDSIDNCCRNHDHCYERVNRVQCNSLTHTKVYFASYHWYKHQGLIYCLNSDECQQATCMCDKKASICFYNHLIEYNESNQLPFMNNNECQQASCMCDKTAAMCFRDHLSDYKESNQSQLGKILGGLFKHR